MKFSAGALALSGLTLFAAHGATEAQYKPRQAEPRLAGVYRYVEVELRGGRRVTAPIRRGPYGDEVLVADVGWIKCGWNCRYTLQKNVFDPNRRWGKDAEESGPGYLTWYWSW
ncbi:MAG: hypothetical protein F9K29_25280 [Hyphomicrobiaceae bacterium]|nr:MAG: hypothetical protein F9K29_25280 [Hyphomicrobiaceae bacterium]